jgi:hypothetical protein
MKSHKMKKDNHSGCPSISIAVVKPYLFAVFFAGNNGKMITANRATTSNTTNMSFGFKYLNIKRLIAFRKEIILFCTREATQNMPFLIKYFLVKKQQNRKLLKN